MTVRTSILLKPLMYLAKKWPEMVVKWPTSSIVRFVSDQSLCTVSNPLCNVRGIAQDEEAASLPMSDAWCSQFHSVLSPQP